MANAADGRDKMIAALQELVIPVLRNGGFVGRFPHFRRVRSASVDLLTFQFDKWGGGFVVEVGSLHPAQADLLDLATPLEKLRAVNLPFENRIRLNPSSTDDPSKDWFRYDQLIYLGNVYRAQAKRVLALLKAQAEPWWTERCQPND